MQNKVIGIIGAMDCEIAEIRNAMQNVESVNAGILTVYKGLISSHDIILVKSGVGKANAAMCAQFIIDNYKPDFIINTGVAGGLGENLEIGDIVIGKDLVQYDFDVTALGYALGYMCTGVNKDKPTVYSSSDELINKFETIIGEKSPETGLHKGIIGTGDRFVGDINKKKEIREKFNAIAAEMEGAAIAQTANMNTVPCLIIRSISDLADGSQTHSQDEFEQKTAKISSKAVKLFIENI